MDLLVQPAAQGILGILLGSFGLFFTLVMLFARVLPVIATTEVKAILPGAQPRRLGGDHE